MGCSKQNISYWELHRESTQFKKSVYNVIHNAAVLFNLSDIDAEALANSAGLSLSYEGGALLKNLKYSGKPKDLCDSAVISDRMLRYYKYKTPTKQALLAITIALNMDRPEIEDILRKYGYCLSESIAADAVIRWFLNSHSKTRGRKLLELINYTLDKMGLPLLMTRN